MADPAMADRPIGWTIVVPLKVLPGAKSRLAVGLDPAAHARLVEAIRSDTLAAAADAGRILLVYDQPSDDETDLDVAYLVQREPGLNAALREGALAASANWPGDGVAALVGDLPALRSSELTAALRLAAEHPRCFVADASGTGTSLLTARPGVGLDPQFGPDSAARHARIAHSLPAGPGLRLDVDTADDLAQALELGVGPATRAAV
jgi:2-phospho-L-lactate/phosphoenolpyruvate guanylyltransferase